MSEAGTELSHWRLERDPRGLVWLALDRQGSGTNVLSRAVLGEFAKVLEQLEQAPPPGLILYSAKDGSFIAGADINEFPGLGDEQQAFDLTRRGQQLLERLAGLPCPTVAVINGLALGGGLELAMACSWRLALESHRPALGLPEVNLGLHPGFGGTVRTVQLTGVRAAMGLMLTGRSVTPAQARRMGLVDQVVAAEHWRATAGALAMRAPPRRRPPWLDALLGSAPVRPFFARVLRNRVAGRARPDHYPAPFAMVDLWRQHAGRGVAAYEAEARSFARLVQTPTSRNLVRVFGLQERLKRTAPADAPRVSRVHVVGAGVMGGDIAAWCALRGLEVTLQDRELKYVEPALERAAALFAKRLRGPGEADAARQRLVADVAGDGVAGADVVIEAIFENQEAKQALYAQLEPRMPAHAILATNTSSIPLQALAPGLERPGRLVGLHFFNPVAKLPLVEIVSAPATDAAATGQALAFARQIGKLPLPCRSEPGFLVNRMLGPYMAEAMELVREGRPAAEVDQAAVDFGMPMGPVELADSVGLDVAMHVATTLAPVIGRPVAPEVEAHVAAGRLGRKTGEGFYRYRDGKPQRPRVAPGTVPAEVGERLVLALLNEAAACLGDGVVADADLVDAGAVFGTGFAPFRGGPLNYAREQGIDDIVGRLQGLETRFGERFRPAAGWARLR